MVYFLAIVLFSEISGCGRVYQITPVAVLGNQLQIAYVPGPNIQYPPNTRIWRVILLNGCHSGCQIEVNRTEMNTEIYDSAKKEYVLTVKRLTQTSTKSLYVQCGPTLRTENIDIMVLGKGCVLPTSLSLSLSLSFIEKDIFTHRLS